MVMSTCVFPGDAARPFHVAPQFAREAERARAAGLLTIPAAGPLTEGDARATVAGVPGNSGPVWWRGRPVSPGRYAELAGALAERGCGTVTSPDQYRRSQDVRLWSTRLAAVTPASAWITWPEGGVPGEEQLARLAAALGAGPAVVTGWNTPGAPEGAVTVAEASDTSRLAAAVLLAAQPTPDLRAVGAILRAPERYVPDSQARVWWVDGEPVSAGTPPGRRVRWQPDLAEITVAVAALDCRFVRTDLALRRDGRWRVVGAGDGQVSELPPGADHTALFEALNASGVGTPPVLRQGRLTLRAQPPSAAARLADGDPAGLEWIEGSPPEGTWESAGIIVRAVSLGLYHPGWGCWTITRTRDGVALGSICFHGPPDREGLVEIGYVLSPAARGAGWGTEAVRLLCGWALERPGVTGVFASTEAENTASQRVLERGGFRRLPDDGPLLAYRLTRMSGS